MKLCEHLQPIYEEEIRKGNTVASVFAPENTLYDIIVGMKKVLPDSEPCSNIRAEKPPQSSPWEPPMIEYHCRKCRGMIFSYYDDLPDEPFQRPCPWALATPENVYFEDGDHFGGCPPTVVTEEQRREIEEYWAARPEEKERLYRERHEWADKKSAAQLAHPDTEDSHKKAEEEIRIADQHIDEIHRKLVLGYGWDNFPKNRRN